MLNTNRCFDRHSCYHLQDEFVVGRVLEAFSRAGSRWQVIFHGAYWWSRGLRGGERRWSRNSPCGCSEGEAVKEDLGTMYEKLKESLVGGGGS